MAENISISEMRDFAKKAVQCLAAVGGKMELLASNNSKAIIKGRVFNDGEDAHGALIGGGKYSKAYAAYRKASGKSTSRVNLQFTDRLFNSLVVRKFDGHWGLGFTPVKRSDSPLTNFQLSEILEKNYKQDIFSIGDKEADRVLASLDKFIEKQLDKCL